MDEVAGRIVIIAPGVAEGVGGLGGAIELVVLKCGEKGGEIGDLGQVAFRVVLETGFDVFVGDAAVNAAAGIVFDNVSQAIERVVFVFSTDIQGVNQTGQVADGIVIVSGGQVALVGGAGAGLVIADDFGRAASPKERKFFAQNELLK